MTVTARGPSDEGQIFMQFLFPLFFFCLFVFFCFVVFFF